MKSSFIGEVDGLLIRFEWPDSKSAKEQPAPRPEGGRIFVAWSAAAGAVPATEHIQAIRAPCAAGFHPFYPELDTVPTTRTEPLSKHSADVLAHASLERIVTKWLVVLSACDSGNPGVLGSWLGSVAQTLHRCGFQSVIASRFPLSVAASITLSECFYGELLSGPKSLEAAFLSTRKRLASSDAGQPFEQCRLDWVNLQLYAHNDDGDDTRPVVVPSLPWPVGV